MNLSERVQERLAHAVTHRGPTGARLREDRGPAWHDKRMTSTRVARWHHRSGVASKISLPRLGLERRH